MANSTVELFGNLEIEHLDSFGNLIEKRSIHNLIVTTGKQLLASLLSNTPETAIDYMALGTGTTTPVIGDTHLQTEIGTRVACPGVWLSGTQVTTFSATFAPGNATGTLTEAGLFNSSVTGGGTMLSHTTFAAVTKASGDTINVTWTITVS